MYKILFTFITGITFFTITACTSSNEANVSDKKTNSTSSGKCQISKCNSDKQYKMR